MVRDFEGGTGAFMGMVSALGAGAWAMRAAGAKARMRAAKVESFMGIRVYRGGGWMEADFSLGDVFVPVLRKAVR